MTTMQVDKNPLTGRRIQFIGIGVNKLAFKSINIINILQGHIGSLEPWFYSTHFEQSLFNLEAIMYLKSLMHVYPL